MECVLLSDSFTNESSGETIAKLTEVEKERETKNIFGSEAF